VGGGGTSKVHWVVAKYYRVEVASWEQVFTPISEACASTRCRVLSLVQKLANPVQMPMPMVEPEDDFRPSYAHYIA